MARIRSIHPDFPSDKKLAKVCRDARLAFVCCWCIADDAGLFRAYVSRLLRTDRTQDGVDGLSPGDRARARAAELERGAAQ